MTRTSTRLLESQLPAWDGGDPGDSDLVAEAQELEVGRLSNGMACYFRRNAEPRDRVECSVIVRAGSIDESDEERGLAHMIEHLAFRGRKEETGSWGVMRELESHGVKFGSHQNAYTSFEETVYWLHVPSSYVAGALDCLAALVLDVRLSDDDVEAERKIVIEEWRQNLDWNQRASETHFRRMLAGTKFEHRLPIGTLDVIENAPPSRLREFYRKYYVPQNMAVVVVGDLDAAPSLLENAFGKYAGEEGRQRIWPRLCDEYGIVSKNDNVDEEWFAVFGSRPKDSENPPVVSLVDDAEATMTSCCVSTALHWTPPSTIGKFRDWLADDLFQIALNRRLQKRALEARPPFSAASMSVERPVAVCDKGGLSIVSINVEPTRRARAAEALEAALREVERVRTSGFSVEEVDVARVEVLTELVAQYKERDQTESSVFSDECRDHFLLGAPVLATEYEVKLTAMLIKDMTPHTLRQRTEALFPVSARKFVAVTRPKRECWGWRRLFSPSSAFSRGSDAEQEDSAETFVAALKKSTSCLSSSSSSSESESIKADPATFFLPTAPSGYVEKRRELLLYSESEDSPKAASELMLSNGMRVVCARTRFKDDEIVGHGVAALGLSEVNDQWSSTTLFAARAAASLAREYGLFGAPKSDAIDALGGRHVSVGPSTDSYRRALDYDCTADNLEQMLALIHRLFCLRLRRDPDRLETFLELAREGIKHEHKDPKSRYAAACDDLDFCGHAYFRKPFLNDLRNFDAECAADFFDAAFGSAGGWTLSLVGALPDAEVLEPLVNRYLASIPRVAPPEETNETFSHMFLPKPQSESTPLNVTFPSRTRRRVVRFDASAKQSQDDGLESSCTKLSFNVQVDGDGDKQRRLEENMRLDLCSALIEQRLIKRLRMDKSAVYDVSVGVSFATSNPLKNDASTLSGILSLGASHDPTFAGTFESICLEELEKFALDGPDDSELEAVLECAHNDRQEKIRRNKYWAASLARTYISPRFQGDLARTYADTVKTRLQVHADLRNGGGLCAKSILKETFKRAVQLDRRTVCSLLPRRSSLVFLSTHASPSIVAMAAAISVAALAAVVVSRSSRLRR